jgi:phage shock protein A
MSIFSRIANFFSGLFHSIIGNAEQNNPEIAYESAIQNMIQKQGDLKKAVSSIIMLRNKTEAELAEKREKLEEVDAMLETALDDGDDESAVILLEQKESLEDSVAKLETDYANIETQAEESMDALNQYREEIKKLKKEKEEMIARDKVAATQSQIAEQLDGLSLDADIQALQNARDGIHKRIAQADVDRELRNNSIDNKLSKIKQRAGNTKAKKRLAELKAARATKNNKAVAAKTESSVNVTKNL